MAIVIDPPQGWLYGFPKEIPESKIKNMTEWLIEQGYPETLIEEYGDYFYCRLWEKDT